MGTKLFLGILLLVIVVLLWRTTLQNETPEGFETLEDKVQDRTNPLAQLQNPLRNPAAPIGISESAGAALRSLSETALNIPTVSASAGGTIATNDPLNPLSPRIDNENSFLGLVNFCKKTGESANPFGNPAFNANCGMCITSGKLITGESFSKPTGVVVYQADKEAAIREKQQKGLSFTRSIPSLNAATCVGASRSDNALPTLAITAEEYKAFTKRKECQDLQKYGDECSQCVVNKKFSYVPASGGKQVLFMNVWGEGDLTISLNGSPLGEPISLKADSATKVPLGRISENTPVLLKVEKGKTVQGPFLYGFLEAELPNENIYRLPLERFIEKDRETGSFPRRGVGKSFQDSAGLTLAKFLPKPLGDKFSLEGKTPLTFIESDQLATFDCPNSPYVSNQANAELLVADPCLNPRGQTAGNWSEYCLQTKILDAGCTPEGKWYSNGLPDSVKSKDIPGVLSWLREKVSKVTTDVETAMNCLGKDISTPCDAYLNNGSVPDQKCLMYLYTNASEANPRVGRAYSGAGTRFNSMRRFVADGNTLQTLQFCQPSGTLNPTPGSQGEAELKEKAAQGYNGVKGIDAVKAYLSDVFMKATGDLDVNIADDKGGRATSWGKCFGLPIATAPPTQVRTYANNTVTNTPQRCTFDAQAYNDQFPDLQRAFGGNADRLRGHFIEYGLKEGRSPCGTKMPDCKFDPAVYLDLNADVRNAAEADLSKLSRYYWQYSNPVVRKMFMDNFAINHYKTYGINEGRDVCPPK